MTTTILILNQRKEELNFLADTLSQKGYQLITTDQDFDLLNIVNKHNPTPELILIDKLISKADSYQICKEIKLLVKGKDIPIIFINRGEDNFDPEIMFKLGGADYLNYPCSSIEILTRIENQLQLKILTQQLKEKNNRLEKFIPHYQKLEKALEKTKYDLSKLSHLDPITKLSNYQRLKQVLTKEWSRCSRQRIATSDPVGTNISLIIAQINDFDSYKEHYEIELASNCLKILADKIKEVVKRPADLIAFYEQEKFALLLPNTDLQGAEKVAKLLNDSVQELKIPHNYSDISDYVSLTIGIATGIPSTALPANILIEVAEKSLIQALQQGKKNAIVVDSF